MNLFKSTIVIGIFAKKIGMTSVFQGEKLIACTVLETQPCVVTQIKTHEKDGYEAIQIACQEEKQKNATQALTGHCSKATTTPKKKFKEFRDFIMTGNVVDFAVAVILAAAVGLVVNGFVNDIVMPFIGHFLNPPEISSPIVINMPQYGQFRQGCYVTVKRKHFSLYGGRVFE